MGQGQSYDGRFVARVGSGRGQATRRMQGGVDIRVGPGLPGLGLGLCLVRGRGKVRRAGSVKRDCFQHDGEADSLRGGDFEQSLVA